MMAKTLLVVQASYVRENPIIHGGPENGQALILRQVKNNGY